MFDNQKLFFVLHILGLLWQLNLFIYFKIKKKRTLYFLN